MLLRDVLVTKCRSYLLLCQHRHIIITSTLKRNNTHNTQGTMNAKRRRGTRVDGACLCACAACADAHVGEERLREGGSKRHTESEERLVISLTTFFHPRESRLLRQLMCVMSCVSCVACTSSVSCVACTSSVSCVFRSPLLIKSHSPSPSPPPPPPLSLSLCLSLPPSPPLSECASRQRAHTQTQTHRQADKHTTPASTRA